MNTHSVLENVMLKAKEVKNNVVEYCLNHKKTVGAIGLCGLGLFYIYQRYLKNMVDMYFELKRISEMAQNDNTSVVDSVCKQFETSFHNISIKLFPHINKILEKNYSLESTYNELMRKDISRSSDEKKYIWNVLKNKVFISLICTIFVNNLIILISKTNLVLLEKWKKSDSLNYSKVFYEQILNETWMLILSFIEHMCKKIESSLNKNISDNLILHEKYTSKQIKDYFEKSRELIETIVLESIDNFRLEIITPFLKGIEKLISDYEISNLDINEEKNNIVYGSVIFFNEFYDIIFSPSFSLLFLKNQDESYSELNKIIDINYEANFPKINDGELIDQREKTEDKLSLLKIVSFLYNVQTKLTDPENSIFLINKYDSEFYQDFEKFLQYIYK